MKKYALTVDSYENGSFQRDMKPVSVTEDELLEHIKFHLQRGVALQVTIDGEHVLENVLGKATERLRVVTGELPKKQLLN